MRNGMHEKYFLLAEEYHRNLYDGLPYWFHLRDVLRVAREYECNEVRGLNLYFDVGPSCVLHDILEDTSITFNDLTDKVGRDIAEVVYALTNEKGRTRAERANDKYYEGIRENEVAIYVKMCDRMANLQYSEKYSPSMFSMYIKEMPEFLEKVNPQGRFYPLYDTLKSYIPL